MAFIKKIRLILALSAITIAFSGCFHVPGVLKPWTWFHKQSQVIETKQIVEYQKESGLAVGPQDAVNGDNKVIKSSTDTFIAKKDTKVDVVRIVIAPKTPVSPIKELGPWLLSFGFLFGMVTLVYRVLGLSNPLFQWVSRKIGLSIPIGSAITGIACFYADLIYYVGLALILIFLIGKQLRADYKDDGKFNFSNIKKWFEKIFNKKTGA